MTSELSFTFAELSCLVDALADYRKSESNMNMMGHTYEEVSTLRARIRTVMADHIVGGDAQ